MKGINERGPPPEKRPCLRQSRERSAESGGAPPIFRIRFGGGG